MNDDYNNYEDENEELENENQSVNDNDNEFSPLNPLGRKRRNRNFIGKRFAGKVLSTLMEKVIAVSFGKWMLVIVIGLVILVALLISVGDLPAEHVIDSVDDGINGKNINNVNLKLASSNMLNTGSTISFATQMLNSSTSLTIAVADTNNNRKNEDKISERGKTLYNEKGSLLLLKLSEINKLYENYMKGDTVTSEEMDLMSYKVGNSEPGSNDDANLKDGTKVPSIGNSSGGVVSSGQILNGSMLNPMSTRNPSDKNSPNTLSFTDAQLKEFESYLRSVTKDEVRINLVLKALSRVGKSYYSQSFRNYVAENPQYLDCSSFVYWAYIHTPGLGKYSGGINTKSMIYSLSVINYSDLQPGDLLFKNSNGQHVKMFVGLASDGRAMIVECDNFADYSNVNPTNHQVGNVIYDALTNDEYKNYCRRWPDFL